MGLKENKPQVSCQVVLDYEEDIKRLNRRVGLKNTQIKKLNERIQQLETEKEKQVEINNDGLKLNAEFKEQNRVIKESYNQLKRDADELKKMNDQQKQDYENLEIVQKDLQSATETLNKRFNEANEKLKTHVHNNEELSKELQLNIEENKIKDEKCAVCKNRRVLAFVKVKTFMSKRMKQKKMQPMTISVAVDPVSNTVKDLLQNALNHLSGRHPDIPKRKVKGGNADTNRYHLKLNEKDKQPIPSMTKLSEYIDTKSFQMGSRTIPVQFYLYKDVFK